MLTENDIVDCVAEYLKNQGWTILQTQTTLQQGIDVLAEKGDEKLAVEAKGEGSARPGTARYGQHFDAKQKRSHVAVALLTAIQVLSDGKYKAGLAFPDDKEHARLITRILPTLNALGIRVFLVRPDRTVYLATP